MMPFFALSITALSVLVRLQQQCGYWLDCPRRQSPCNWVIVGSSMPLKCRRGGHKEVCICVWVPTALTTSNTAAFRGSNNITPSFPLELFQTFWKGRILSQFGLDFGWVNLWKSDSKLECVLLTGQGKFRIKIRNHVERIRWVEMKQK